MGEKTRTGSETFKIDLEKDAFERLVRARGLYESDTNTKISFSDLVDRLVFAYLLFREKRGQSESIFLEKLATNPDMYGVPDSKVTS